MMRFVRIRPSQKQDRPSAARHYRPALEACEIRSLLTGSITTLTVTPVMSPVLENPDMNTSIEFTIELPFTPEGAQVAYWTTDGATGCPDPALNNRDYLGIDPLNPKIITFSGTGPGDPFKAVVSIPVVGSYLIKPELVCFTIHAAVVNGTDTADATGGITNLNSTIVTNTNQTGYGSMFGAISSSNVTPGPHTISFNIPASTPVTIPILSPLPALINPAAVDIEGGTQPGTSALPRVILDGSSAGSGAAGLSLLAGNTTVRSLGIHAFSGPGIIAQGNESDIIDGNFIDVNGLSGIVISPGSNGAKVTSNVVHAPGGVGIRVVAGANDLVQGNSVGNAGLSGILLEQGNQGTRVLKNTVLSSQESGIWVDAGDANLVAGNVVGQPGAGNGQDGITVINATRTVIGGTNVGDGNVVMSNGLVGIRVASNPENANLSVGNSILGNTVGVGAGQSSGPGNAANAGTTGPLGQGNSFGGIFLDDAIGTTVGGAAPGARNFIGGNGGAGVQVTFGQGNKILGNWIGVDSTGTGASGNAYDGVYIDRSPNNQVGGTNPGEGNLISANGYVGVRVYGPQAAFNAVQGNRIGTDATGTKAIPNAYDGVFILSGANHNLIGGTTPGAGNLISGNLASGIDLFGAGTSANILAGNFIGVAFGGLSALPNKGDGVFLNNAPGNFVGLQGAGNLISGNLGSGVQLFGAGTNGNTVQANSIGFNSKGQPTLGNTVGIFINHSGQNTIAGNAIGGNKVAPIVTATPAGNVVSFPNGSVARGIASARVRAKRARG